MNLVETLLRPRRGAAAGAGGPPARQGLARALGALWILDGLLQLQPAMLTRAFLFRVAMWGA
jgi:hypothetical protein